MTGGDTVSVSHVYHNRDLLKDYHARGARAPGSAAYELSMYFFPKMIPSV